MARGLYRATLLTTPAPPKASVHGTVVLLDPRIKAELNQAMGIAIIEDLRSYP